MPHSIPNPSLADLEVLVGDWSVEIVFPGDPPSIVRGSDSFAWLEGGAVLAIRSEAGGGGPPNSFAVVGRDDASETYSMLYVDVRGVSRVYEMSFADGVWALRRAAPTFHQRFIGTLGEDGDRIDARWEKSQDGSDWQHDFDLTYRRVAATDAV